MSELSELLRADGFDSPLASITPDAWATYVKNLALRLEINPGSSVLEVGCGAGAFLYVLQQLGCKVGGCDFSSAQIEIAKQALPNSTFQVCDATQFEMGKWDYVLANGVFMYFPSLEYAEKVCKLMVETSKKAVGIFDVPDLRCAKTALETRISAAGGEAEYAARYEGLDHQYYDRNWLVFQLQKHAVNNITFDDQKIEGYGNAAFRFNIWGFCRND
ncbi:MAG: class I SAM-dependent methyltransferase [Acidimicrobiaceae bacterium]|nr:class I SAM-dependent methyltransferase [Acidimicrobiaceae bacterium]